MTRDRHLNLSDISIKTLYISFYICLFRSNFVYFSFPIYPLYIYISIFLYIYLFSSIFCIFVTVFYIFVCYYLSYIWLFLPIYCIFLCFYLSFVYLTVPIYPSSYLLYIFLFASIFSMFVWSYVSYLLRFCPFPCFYLLLQPPVPHTEASFFREPLQSLLPKTLSTRQAADVASRYQLTLDPEDRITSTGSVASTNTLHFLESTYLVVCLVSVISCFRKAIIRSIY
ncbi:unnamed protein product [Acanthosepion pharaonis]|uniref:Uncharacterized protein n=1 Tax=Acanthosepion pharaonis TaxID=158019 RepID=A0A812BCZ1_ACAPH|nr:unnamed protein product [Sepia pharaonis]